MIGLDAMSAEGSRARHQGYWIAAALFAAILSGVAVGFSTCGGYSWQEPTALVVSLGFAAPAGLAAVRNRVSSRGRTALIIVAVIGVVVGAFVVGKASGAAFYPNNPGSVANFLKAFLHALRYGPC